MLEYVSERWPEIKRGLRRICVRDHGRALLDSLCNPGAPAAAADVVRDWVDRVARDLDARIVLRAKDTGEGSGTPWPEVLALFFNPAAMAKQLDRSRGVLCGHWCSGNTDMAYSVMWTSLSDYFYEAKFALDGVSGQHRLRNWDRIRKARGEILRQWQQQAASLNVHERRWAEQRMQDPAAMAAAIIERHEDPNDPLTLDDVASIEGVLAYLYAYLPPLNTGDVEDRWIATLPCGVLETLIHCLEARGNPAGLSDAERSAVILEYMEGIPSMSDAEFHARYGFTRQTFRNRLGRAHDKLAPCLKRYLDPDMQHHG